MSNISEVLYEEISEEYCINEKAGEFYFHLNTLKLHSRFQEEYEKYEIEHISLRNRIIRGAINRGEIDNNPKMNTTIFGVSAINNRPILVVEI